MEIQQTNNNAGDVNNVGDAIMIRSTASSECEVCKDPDNGIPHYQVGKKTKFLMKICGQCYARAVLWAAKESLKSE